MAINVIIMATFAPFDKLRYFTPAKKQIFNRVISLIIVFYISIITNF